MSAVEQMLFGIENHAKREKKAAHRPNYRRSLEIVLNLTAAGRGRTIETELFAFISLLFLADSIETENGEIFRNDLREIASKVVCITGDR